MRVVTVRVTCRFATGAAALVPASGVGATSTAGAGAASLGEASAGAVGVGRRAGGCGGAVGLLGGSDGGGQREGRGNRGLAPMRL